jgi:hypothetical protein
MKKIIDIASALASSLLPKSRQSEIDSYGQSNSGMTQEEIQSVMEWLMGSLLNAGYLGKSHLIWDTGKGGWEKPMLTGVLRDEPVFLYRCGERPSPPPDNCYWRLMPEYPSQRIYQLEARE